MSNLNPEQHWIASLATTIEQSTSYEADCLWKRLKGSCKLVDHNLSSFFSHLWSLHTRRLPFIWFFLKKILFLRGHITNVTRNGSITGERNKSKLGVAQSCNTKKTVSFIIIYYLRPSALEDLLRIYLQPSSPAIITDGVKLGLAFSKILLILWKRNCGSEVSKLRYFVIWGYFVFMIPLAHAALVLVL